LLSTSSSSPCLPPRLLHSFPTRRSSDLHTSWVASAGLSSKPFRMVSPRQRRNTSSPNTVACVNSLSFPLPVLVNTVGIRNGSKRSEEHTSELQSRENLVCRLLLEKKKKN